MQLESKLAEQITTYEQACQNYAQQIEKVNQIFKILLIKKSIDKI